MGNVDGIFTTVLDTEKRLSLWRYQYILRKQVLKCLPLYSWFPVKTFGTHACWLCSTRWLPPFSIWALTIKHKGMKYKISIFLWTFFHAGILILGFFFFFPVRKRLVALATNVWHQGWPLLLLSARLTLLRESGLVSSPSPPRSHWEDSLEAQHGPACHSRSLPNGLPQQNPEISLLFLTA